MLYKVKKSEELSNLNREKYSSSQCKRDASNNALLRDTTSVTTTMLRLISPFSESDGRCVHASDFQIFMIKNKITSKSTFIDNFNLNS